MKLGPFNGGLNLKSDASALANNEVARCENFEIDFDGSLRSRPPMVDLGTAARFPLSATGGFVRLLGYYRLNDDTSYLIASDGVSSTYYFSGTQWVSIPCGFAAADIQGFNGALWLGNKAGAGGYWNGTSYTAVTAMPVASAMCVYKGRLFVSGGKGAAGVERYTMHISGVPNFDNPLFSATTESAKPPVAIGGGDGESIVTLLNYQSQILVFRTGSIWSYSYTTDPNLFTQSALITNIGLDDPLAIDTLDGVVYFMFEGRAYALTNGRVQQINDKVPFAAATRTGYATPVAVSVFGRRVMFSYYDVTYVFSPDTQTWSTWTSPTYNGLGKVYQRIGVSDPNAVAIGFPNVNPPLATGRYSPTLRMTDGFSADKEAAVFTAVMQTKNYDYDVPSQHKALFWWGVDTTFKSKLVASAFPIAYHSTVTWADMLTTTWADALNYTWDQPKSASVVVTTNRDATGLGPLKKFVKLAKKLRFVQISYKVSIDTDGSTTTGPVKIFDIETYILQKEHVVKAIS